MCKMRFLEPDAYQSRCCQIYKLLATEIQALVPKASIYHIGSSAVGGLLSKGDLDILVQVFQEDFSQARKKLFDIFEDNVGSHQSETLQSFIDPRWDWDVGVQLVVQDGPEDNFLTFLERLQHRPNLVKDYNRLKLESVGLSASVYRLKKSRFIMEVLDIS